MLEGCRLLSTEEAWDKEWSSILERKRWGGGAHVAAEVLGKNHGAMVGSTWKLRTDSDAASRRYPGSSSPAREEGEAGCG